jgi:hypothetical protein
MDTWVMLATLLLGSGANVGTEPGLGTIEGELMFPACTLPDDLQVCAEDASSGAKACTRTFGGQRYRLELPPGRYAVYAQTESARPGYRAYYSAAVACGLTVSCTDHQPLSVDVKPGRASTQISPADWNASEGDVR